jgi:hypothetical protein
MPNTTKEGLRRVRKRNLAEDIKRAMLQVQQWDQRIAMSQNARNRALEQLQTLISAKKEME